MRRVIVCVVFGVLLAVYGTSMAQVTPADEMEKDIRELLYLTGVPEVGTQVMNQMLVPMKQALPEVPEAFWTRFMEKVDPDDLVDMSVPIYAKYFTHDEIKQLLEFYRTPIGQKVIGTLPAVMQESMAAGQRWGEQLSQQVIEELSSEGYY